MTLERMKRELEACRKGAVEHQDTFDTEIASRYHFQELAYDYALSLLAEYEASLTLPQAPQQPPASTG